MLNNNFQNYYLFTQLKVFNTALYSYTVDPPNTAAPTPQYRRSSPQYRRSVDRLPQIYRRCIDRPQPPPPNTAAPPPNTAAPLTVSPKYTAAALIDPTPSPQYRRWFSSPEYVFLVIYDSL